MTVTGGFAGDGNRLQRTAVWCDSEPRGSTVAALGFYGDRLKVGFGVTGGWGPFGPDRIITKSNGNVLLEIDGRPALGLYKEYLGEHAKGLPASGLLFPMELRIPDSNCRVLRALLAVNENDQSITFAGNMPEGACARLMVGNIESLIDGASEAAASSKAMLEPAEARLSILVSCNGRRMVLKQRIEEEVEAVARTLGKESVLTGFYSYGEVAPGGRVQPALLHNETMTITNFAEV